MTTLVVGASRGLGRGMAEAIAATGTPVIAISRTPSEPAAAGIHTEVADATDPAAVARLLDRYDPDAVVVVAGAVPSMGPLHTLSWEAFSVNWHADVRIAFEWLGAILRRPLRPGSRVIVISSGAALAGSPVSGGYAGSKATQRMMTDYAREEAGRAGLDLTLTAVLPGLTPVTGLGRGAVRAYAARAGRTEEEQLRDLGEPLTAEAAGAAVVELLTADADTVASSYRLAPSGLTVIAGSPARSAKPAPAPASSGAATE
jgi:NAD(P)-dependent dehydrogenase (short-subunit alcohol dehydrogenase family)